MKQWWQRTKPPREYTRLCVDEKKARRRETVRKANRKYNASAARKAADRKRKQNPKYKAQKKEWDKKYQLKTERAKKRYWADPEYRKQRIDARRRHHKFAATASILAAAYMILDASSDTS
jgi:hypothetical protein